MKKFVFALSLMFVFTFYSNSSAQPVNQQPVDQQFDEVQLAYCAAVLARGTNIQACTQAADIRTSTIAMLGVQLTTDTARGVKESADNIAAADARSAQSFIIFRDACIKLINAAKRYAQSKFGYNE